MVFSFISTCISNVPFVFFHSTYRYIYPDYSSNFSTACYFVALVVETNAHIHTKLFLTKPIILYIILSISFIGLPEFQKSCVAPGQFAQLDMPGPGLTELHLEYLTAVSTSASKATTA